jgi:hypothetical protein
MRGLEIETYVPQFDNSFSHSEETLYPFEDERGVCRSHVTDRGRFKVFAVRVSLS